MDFSNIEVTIDHIADAGAKIKAYATVTFDGMFKVHGVRLAESKQGLNMRGEAQLIRRLTPLECERLQGFPDDWTALSRAPDSARYRALGNSVAIPCVEFIMKSLRKVTKLEAEQSQMQGDHHAEK